MGRLGGSGSNKLFATSAPAGRTLPRRRQKARPDRGRRREALARRYPSALQRRRHQCSRRSPQDGRLGFRPRPRRQLQPTHLPRSPQYDKATTAVGHSNARSGPIVATASRSKASSATAAHLPRHRARARLPTTRHPSPPHPPYRPQTTLLARCAPSALQPLHGVPIACQHR
jgi:hypothetical protein